MKKNIDHLLARYFGGTASEKDMQTLEKWISASAENQTYFDEMTNLYGKLGGSDATEPTVDTGKALSAFMTHMETAKPVKVIESKHKTFYTTQLFRAASILIIVTLSISGWLYLNSERQVVMATRMDQKQRILSDQTQVDLSKNSKISYSSHYGKKAKRIMLEGEARFKVGHQGTGTLQVCADETIIEDIGTTFAVSAYPDNQRVSVTVSEGKVHFFSKNNEGIMLEANETGIYNKKTKTFGVLKPKTDSGETRVTHVQFNAMPLNKALETLSANYGVRIRFGNAAIARRKITVNFDGENIDMILQVIAETLDLNVAKDKNGYLLTDNTKSTTE